MKVLYKVFHHPHGEDIMYSLTNDGYLYDDINTANISYSNPYFICIYTTYGKEFFLAPCSLRRSLIISGFASVRDSRTFVSELQECPPHLRLNASPSHSIVNGGYNVTKPKKTKKQLDFEKMWGDG